MVDDYKYVCVRKLYKEENVTADNIIFTYISEYAINYFLNDQLILVTM